MSHPPRPRHASRRRRAATRARVWPGAVLLFAALVSLLAPLLHQLAHDYDHVHTPYGIVLLGPRWSWGAHDAVDETTAEYGHYADALSGLEPPLPSRAEHATHSHAASATHAAEHATHTHAASATHAHRAGEAQHPHPHPHDRSAHGQRGPREQTPQRKDDRRDERAPMPGHGRQALEHFQAVPVLGNPQVVVIVDQRENDAELPGTALIAVSQRDRARRPLCRGPPTG